MVTGRRRGGAQYDQQKRVSVRDDEPMDSVLRQFAAEFGYSFAHCTWVDANNLDVDISHAPRDVRCRRRARAPPSRARWRSSGSLTTQSSLATSPGRRRH